MIFAGGALLQQHLAFGIADEHGERAVLQAAPVGFHFGSEADLPVRIVHQDEGVAVGAVEYAYIRHAKAVAAKG